MFVIFFLIVYCSLVYGDCQFHTNNHTKDVQEKMEKLKIYQNLTISNNGLTYLIGICSSPTNNNAAIIQKGNNFSYIIGRLDSVNLVGGDNWILLTYENGDPYINECNNSIRSASIVFICGPNKDLTILQEHTNTDLHCNYIFQLKVPEMCLNIEKSNKLGGGAIFLIIIFSLATVYLVVGAVFMHIKRGARGLDHIPNFEMWRKLGHLAADGCDFCCRCERAIPRAGYLLDESGPDMHGDDDILSP